MLRKPAPSFLYRFNIPSRWLLTGTVLISLGLHGALLGLPLPGERQAKEPETPEIDDLDTIKILSMDGNSSGTGSAVKPEQPSKPPEGAAKPTPTQTRTDSASTRSAATQSAAQGTENSTTTSNAPNTGDGGQPPGSGPDSFPTLPDYPGVQSGSAGFFLMPEVDLLAEHTTDATALVVQFYQDQLIPQNGFDSFGSIREGSFFEIFEVTVANQTPRFLHLVEHEDKVVIFMGPKELTAEELLRNQNFATASEEQRLVERILAQAAPKNSLALPDIPQASLDAAFSNQTDGLVARGKIPSQAVAKFKQALTNESFNVQEIVPDGELYTITHPNDSNLYVLVALMNLGDGDIGIVSGSVL
ncbi:MAG: hypothetical protein ACPGVO_13115 [Spirulinaceae cyanobacterium]